MLSVPRGCPGVATLSRDRHRSPLEPFAPSLLSRDYHACLCLQALCNDEWLPTSLWRGATMRLSAIATTPVGYAGASAAASSPSLFRRSRVSAPRAVTSVTGRGTERRTDSPPRGRGHNTRRCQSGNEPEPCRSSDRSRSCLLGLPGSATGQRTSGNVRRSQEGSGTGPFSQAKSEPAGKRLGCLPCRRSWVRVPSSALAKALEMGLFLWANACICFRTLALVSRGLQSPRPWPGADGSAEAMRRQPVS